MTYDKKVPQMLKREQQWFGSIIGRAIDEDSRMNPVSPSGESMELEAAEHILPSPGMRPAQRIQIYNQQYWWRLLGTLQDIFPTLTRIVGFYDFNRNIGIPFLEKYPPFHWSLNSLGDRLPDWLDKEYHAADRELVCQIGRVDWAYNDSFVIKGYPSLTPADVSDGEKAEEVLSKPLYAQPYLHLFASDMHLFHFKENLMLQPTEYWLDHDLPTIERKGPYFFVLYRNARNEISWKEVSEGEHALLNFFKKGITIEEACQWLEKQDEALYETAVENLQLWFQEWTHRGWLSQKAPYESP